MSSALPRALLHRATLSDVAREAGVSLATVDRALNRRPGVRAPTLERVNLAVEKLGYRPDPIASRLASREVLRFAFVLPAGSNEFMEDLRLAAHDTATWLSAQRAFVDVINVDVFDPDALAHTLETIDPAYRGVAVVALDHPRVRAAIDDLAERGVSVVTLVSDVPTSRRVRYVGIDNTAAGRTAGTLLGRFTGGRPGTVGIIAGSLALRDHAERLFGLGQVLGGEYPALRALPVRESRDSIDQARAIAAALLDEHPDLVALYNTGAGNRGIAQALEDAGRAASVVFVGHDLTAHTRRLLVRGVMDAVINQDAGHQSRSAARLLLAHCTGDAIVAAQERIRIDIFLRDNLP
jgi:LacI family transcriptional regulator